MASSSLVWRQLYWPTDLQAIRLAALLRTWASDDLVGPVVLETRASGDGVRWLIGTHSRCLSRVLDAARSLVPGLTVSPAKAPVERAELQTVRRVVASTAYRPLGDDPDSVARAVYGALARTAKTEELVIQVVLGPHHRAMAVPATTSDTAVRPWWQAAISGGKRLDADRRQALKTKLGTHGFGLVLRIGVRAARPDRRKSLLLSLFAGLRSAEAPGTHLRLLRDVPVRLHQAYAPWIWPMKLNVIELTSVVGAPIVKDLPGLPRAHPKPVAPTAPAKDGDRILADATAPGAGQIGYSVADASQHTWVMGPNGTGKSTLLLNLITQDMNAGHAVVVVEPKDLVADVLARVPKDRRDDVVLLDAADPEAVVGFNPLALDGRSPDLVADTLLGIFHDLYADSWGPRTADVLQNGLLCLARAKNASLVMLPLLLSNAAFRRRFLKQPGVLDPIATGPFWAAFEAMSDAERSHVIAPAMNKIRPWIIRPSLRAAIGQTQPRFTIRQGIEQNKIVLVPLSKGALGPEGAQLLAALVLSETWQAIRERVSRPAKERTPVMVYVDEVQDFLRLPTDLADVLAMSRSLGAYFHLAHQYRDQLSPSMRSAFDTNARTRIVFQLTATDAKAMAAGQTVLSPEDFTSLPAYSVYASVMRAGHLTPWASGRTLPPPKKVADPEAVRRRSRKHYARPIAEIEADLMTLIDGSSGEPSTPTGRVRRAQS
jgi:hypothetical protein